MGRELKAENTLHTIFMGSGAAKLEGGPDVGILGSAMKKYCLVREDSLKNLEDEYELETSSVLTENVNLLLTDPAYNTRVLQNQSNYAHEVVSKRYRENAFREMRNVVAPRAHGHRFCLNLMFRRWNRSLLASKEKRKNEEERLEKTIRRYWIILR